jgi:hypothetical protein
VALPWTLPRAGCPGVHSVRSPVGPGALYSPGGYRAVALYPAAARPTVCLRLRRRKVQLGHPDVAMDLFLFWHNTSSIIYLFNQVYYLYTARKL